MRVAVAAGLCLGANGIVRRSDVADSEYTIDASSMPHVVMINPSIFEGEPVTPVRSRLHRHLNATEFNVECGGTMISKKHAITAAHCFEGGRQKGFKVNVNGKKYTAAATHFNPSCTFNLLLDGPDRCDVAIVELGSETDVEPVPVYQWDDEKGKHMDFYGWGVAGKAGKVTAKQCDEGAEDGKFRHGENTVKSVSANPLGGGLISYTMSKNNAKDTLPHEAICASGDSGSPLFLEGPDGKKYIAGTNSGSDDNNACAYGATDHFCRLSRHYDWIQSVIGGSPAPTPPAPTPPTPPAPTPPAPTPPAPTPPAPTPSECPGGSLSSCIDICPTDDDAVFRMCVDGCKANCPQLVTV